MMIFVSVYIALALAAGMVWPGVMAAAAAGAIGFLAAAPLTQGAAGLGAKLAIGAAFALVVGGYEMLDRGDRPIRRR